MANPSGSRGDAAYARALGAYQERSYDAARMWVLEALAHDPQHAGARALLGRLDAARQPASPLETTPAGIPLARGSQGETPGRGSEVISTDPTLLISRASGPVTPEPVEPTMVIQRDDPRLHLARTDMRAAASPPGYTAGRPVAEPTIIIQPKPRPAPSGPGSSSVAGSAVQSLWQRLWPRGHRAPSPRPPSPARRGGTTSGRASGMWTPGLRGTLIAVAAVAVAVLVVWGAIGAGRWLWPPGQQLTLAKPLGGTITGPGLQCGTRSSDCSTTRPTGDVVELTAKADDGYVFGGFTGDCAETGRASMTQPRQCGASFDRVVTSPQAVMFTLTIIKPTGGTVFGVGITCGTQGSDCSADMQNGKLVTLSPEADTGWTFSQFTGDCPPNSEEITMTAAKTCGAAFIRTSTPVANRGPSGPTGPPEPRRPKEATEATPPTPTPPSAASPPEPPVPQGPGPTPVVPNKPAERPITAEQHAMNAIERLVKNYCAALETLKADRVKEWFPLAPEADLRGQFSQYKSLKCTPTLPLKYELLVAGPAGAARVAFEMKKVIQWKRKGGVPETQETIVTINVSRKDGSSDWQIDFVRHEPKPKT